MQRLSARCCALALALGALVLATGATAQWGGTISADSDDRYRGVSLSDSAPSLRLTANYDSPERWYAGASLTRAVGSSESSYTQTTAYAGTVTPVLDSGGLELGATASHFFGRPSDDFGEIYVGAVGRMWSARLYYSPSYYGRHVQTAYLELDSHLPLSRRARLFAHVGALFPLQGATGDADKRRYDARVGSGMVIGGWDLHLAATAVTPHGPYPAVYVGRRVALQAGASLAF